MKITIVSLLFLQNIFVQEKVPSPVFVSPPIEVVDPEIKSLEWNRYVTKNFTILSIDNQKGKQLAETIDSLKSLSLTKWGFPDVKFTKECRVFCVPNYNLLKKLFNLNASKVQGPNHVIL